MSSNKAKDLIFKILQEKTLVKNQVTQHLDAAFKMLFSECKSLCNDLRSEFHKKGQSLLLECNERNSNSFEFRFGDESLVFHKLNQVLQLEKSHSMWSNSYLSDNYLNSYCGLINIYNFTNDSFRSNKMEEPGYLIARVFVNRENHFFTEGKRQMGFLYNDFDNSVVENKIFYSICQSALLYCLDFDATVAEYDTVSAISVGALKDQIDYSISPAQKKLGFKFYTDDQQK